MPLRPPDSTWEEFFIIKLAGAEGFEPPSSVLETDSLTVELTPLYQGSGYGSKGPGDLLLLNPVPCAPCPAYFVSLCAVCFRQRLQNFENSRRPVVVFLFFVVE